MRELSLKEIQTISIEILSEVHNFCVLHHLRYFLMYGSLIGAIRHKGFIPWDNDIDIVMPRNDYDRFCNTFKSNIFQIVSDKSSDCYINFCRVYDVDRTVVKTITPYHSRKQQGGVWIDIFPLDGAEDDYRAFQSRVVRMSRLWILQCQERQSKASISSGITFSKRVKLFLKKMILFDGALLNVVKKQLFSMSQECVYGTTHHWTQVACVDDGIKNYQLNEDIEDFSLAEFEGHSFYIPNGYDRILRNIYGDYMVLPPENQRIPKDSKHIKFYWREKN